MSNWRPRGEDWVPLLLIAALPLALALPQLLLWLNADPMLSQAALAVGLTPGPLPGAPYNDPNYGFTTHALGTRAALDWLQGEVPWWNPYSGVGLPLAAEYQPAALFPLTLLLLLPQGMVWQHLALQLLAGWGSYALLRQLGLARLAATTGGLLYAFDGTLALMASGPALQVPFLPWMLLGIERARVCAGSGARGGWRVLACAMAMNLLAGFPETAYVGGLLTLAWAALRAMQLARGQRAAYAAKVALGGSVGIFIAAPQVLAFFVSLQDSWIGMHAGSYGDSALDAAAAVPSLVAPFAFGPIYAYAERWPLAGLVASELGGYVTLALLAVAAFGLLSRRRALGWLLFAWCLSVIAKSFGVEPALSLWNLLPGIASSLFGKYAQATWEFGFIVLAAHGLDDLARRKPVARAALPAAALVLTAGIAVLAATGAAYWPQLGAHVPIRNWAAGSALWALLSGFACLLCMASVRARARLLAGVLIFDSMLMFGIPTLSNPRGGTVDLQAVAFLRDNLGLQRFYTLGPIGANYAAYFGIASINHNYLPVSTLWVQWLRSHLDRGADPVSFIGGLARAAGLPAQAQELRENLAAYRWAGVKYVVAWSAMPPFGDADAGDAAAPRLAYRDPWISIFELPGARPYFETPGSRCDVEVASRTRVSVRCEQPAQLIRRELFFPGWSATVNGEAATVGKHGDLFQAVAVPAGASEVRYDYAPPYMAWGWLAMWLGLAALAAPSLARRPRRHAGEFAS